MKRRNPHQRPDDVPLPFADPEPAGGARVSKFAPKPTGKYARKLDPDTDPAAAPALIEPEASPPAPVGEALAAAAAAARSKRPAPAKPTAVHGRRAKGYVQLNLTVRPEVKHRLAAAAAREGLTMAELLDELLHRVLPNA